MLKFFGLQRFNIQKIYKKISSPIQSNIILN